LDGIKCEDPLCEKKAKRLRDRRALVVPSGSVPWPRGCGVIETITEIQFHQCIEDIEAAQLPAWFV
jgi:hypothetical protein